MEPPGMFRTTGAPGSPRALSDEKAAAWPCRLVELRFCGVYLPVGLLLSRPLHTGWIISRDVGVDIRVCTFTTSLNPGDHQSHVSALTVLLGEDRVRQNSDGTYLLHGTAWDSGHLSVWPQTWLCGPGSEVVTAAVNRMGAWLQARYTGQYRAR